MFHIIAFLGMVRDYVRDALGTILAITHVVLKLLFSNDDESKTRPHFRRLGITYRETLKISTYRFGSTIERAVTCRPCCFFFWQIEGLWQLRLKHVYWYHFFQQQLLTPCLFFWYFLANLLIFQTFSLYLLQQPMICDLWCDGYDPLKAQRIEFV